MVESYVTEADLERAYDNRIILIDESIKTSRMGVANLRMSLLTQLRQAAEAELHGRPVGKPLLQNITGQHADLMRQQQILEQQLREREELDASLQEARERYRSLTDGRRDG
jgi:flagellar biosynthesis/type III secretory pathway chaperone